MPRSVASDLCLYVASIRIKNLWLLWVKLNLAPTYNLPHIAFLQRYLTYPSTYIYCLSGTSLMCVMYGQYMVMRNAPALSLKKIWRISVKAFALNLVLFPLEFQRRIFDTLVTVGAISCVGSQGALVISSCRYIMSIDE